MPPVLSRVVLLAVIAASCACAQAVDLTIQDAALTASVKTALLNDRTIDGTLVVVRTEAGVVHLSGTQPSSEAAEHVVSLVRGVQGVRNVESTIMVVPVAPPVSSTPPS